MACWSTKLAISLKRVKIEEKIGNHKLQIWPIHSQGPSEHKPVKNFGDKGAWAYPGTAQIEYALLSQERVKLRTSNLAGILTGSMRTKTVKNLGE